MTSWQPCWFTHNKIILIHSFVREPTWPLRLLSFVSPGVVWKCSIPYPFNLLCRIKYSEYPSDLSRILPMLYIVNVDQSNVSPKFPCSFLLIQISPFLYLQVKFSVFFKLFQSIFSTPFPLQFDFTSFHYVSQFRRFWAKLVQGCHRRILLSVSYWASVHSSLSITWTITLRHPVLDIYLNGREWNGYFVGFRNLDKCVLSVMIKGERNDFRNEWIINFRAFLNGLQNLKGKQKTLWNITSTII